MPPAPKLPSETVRPFNAILLAAGEGSRMGHIPKSLLRVGGQTLLERQIAMLLKAGACRMIVVTGFYFQEIEAQIVRMPSVLRNAIEVVRNPLPEQGQQTSVLLGLRTATQQTLNKALTHSETDNRTSHPVVQNCSGNDTAVLIALADQPLMQAVDYRTCVDSFYNRPAGREIVYPVFNGQRGNPVTLSEAIAQTILRDGVTCRDFIQAHPELVHRLIVNTDHFTFDLDQPSDLDAFVSKTGQSLTLPEPSSKKL